MISSGWDKITNVANVVIDGIKGLFVPKDGYIDAKVTDLRSRFAFADAIISTVNRFGELLSNVKGDKAPSITINLKNNTTKTNFGKTAEWLDMSWYKPYKPVGDTIISAFLWIVFLWGTFTRLPSIISGGSAGTVALSKINDFDKGN